MRTHFFGKKHTIDAVILSCFLSGMQPVGVHVVASEDSRLSAEERRLARVMNLASVDKKMVHKRIVVVIQNEIVEHPTLILCCFCPVGSTP